MSAQPTITDSLRLEYPGDATLPRRLVLSYYMTSSGRAYLTACIYGHNVKPTVLRTMAYVNELLCDCRLELTIPGNYAVWLDYAVFDVTLDEAREIHATFAPLGLESKFTVSPTPEDL